MIKFKHRKDRKLFCSLHPVLLMIFSDLWYYAYDKHGVELTVTDTVSTERRDKRIGRKSSSHRDGRAIDIRTRDLDAFVMRDIMNYINEKEEYKKYHYVSYSGQERLAYYHFGTGEHIHLAIHKRYANL